MPVSSFDFDVITGPSTSREAPDAPPPQDKPPAPPTGAQPAALPTR